jgi:hypothetical protein
MARTFWLRRYLEAEVELVAARNDIARFLQESAREIVAADAAYSTSWPLNIEQRRNGEFVQLISREILGEHTPLLTFYFARSASDEAFRNLKRLFVRLRDLRIELDVLADHCFNSTPIINDDIADRMDYLLACLMTCEFIERDVFLSELQYLKSIHQPEAA